MYYKVVTKHYDDYFSFIGQYTKYKIGEFVSRGKYNGPLVVFSTLQHAKDFLQLNTTPSFNRIRRPTIFLCEIVPCVDEECVYFNCGKIVPKNQLPIGTVFANSVKLIKEI